LNIQQETVRQDALSSVYTGPQTDYDSTLFSQPLWNDDAYEVQCRADSTQT